MLDDIRCMLLWGYSVAVTQVIEMTSREEPGDKWERSVSAAGRRELEDHACIIEQSSSVAHSSLITAIF